MKATSSEEDWKEDRRICAVLSTKSGKLEKSWNQKCISDRRVEGFRGHFAIDGSFQGAARVRKTEE